jgi:hypothetical protein
VVTCIHSGTLSFGFVFEFVEAVDCVVVVPFPLVVGSGKEMIIMLPSGGTELLFFYCFSKTG